MVHNPNHFECNYYRLTNQQPLLLIRLQMDPSVLGSTLRGFIGGQRVRQTKTQGDKTLFRYTLIE